MSILEIIHLRSSNQAIENLADRITESLWDEGRVPSRLGLNLVSALAAYGLVKHSVWHEISNQSLHGDENCE